MIDELEYLIPVGWDAHHGRFYVGGAFYCKVFLFAVTGIIEGPGHLKGDEPVFCAMDEENRDFCPGDTFDGISVF